ncbi:MAG: hypothetical protein ACI9RP_002980 [Cyclobacteriaceae bacterium]
MENDLQKSMVKSNLKYCESNFRENRYFKEADLEALKRQIKGKRNLCDTLRNF